MWNKELSLTGHCPECGEELTGTVRIWATSAWIERYRTDDRLRRGIDREIERRVIERHAGACVGKPRPAKLRALPVYEAHPA